MNLSQEEIAQKMRLRRSVIEAIENEQWERLPPAVFVKGFVRSYARTLDLDEKKTLELYLRAAPPANDTLRAIAVPRSSHRGVFLVMPAILAVLLCLFYFWHLKSSGRDRESPAVMERVAPFARDERPSAGKEGTLLGAAAPEQAPATVGESGVSRRETPTQAPPKEDQAQPESAPLALILKGAVKERTWMSIRVDGEEHKEYIFQPGARPQWKAMRGFEIVIGNAAGMDLEFDGKTIENLGRPGQVVRLRLPKDYQ